MKARLSVEVLESRDCPSSDAPPWLPDVPVATNLSLVQPVSLAEVDWEALVAMLTALQASAAAEAEAAGRLPDEFLAPPVGPTDEEAVVAARQLGYRYAEEVVALQQTHVRLLEERWELITTGGPAHLVLHKTAEIVRAAARVDRATQDLAILQDVALRGTTAEAAAALRQLSNTKFHEANTIRQQVAASDARLAALPPGTTPAERAAYYQEFLENLALQGRVRQALQFDRQLFRAVYWPSLGPEPPE